MLAPACRKELGQAEFMSEHVDRYPSNRGEAIISLPKEEVMILKVTGHLDRPMGMHIIDAATRASAETKKRLHIFCDWVEMTGYESDVRSAFTQWAASNRTKVTFHLLVGSKLVAMGVSVANLALGGVLVGYTNRASFDAVLRSTKMGLHLK
jgi:hypothetical protein